MNYHINVFYSPEDEGWIANIPDLGYCSAFGQTPDEAVREVMVAQEAWLESCRKHNDPIPEPRYSPPTLREVA